MTSKNGSARGRMLLNAAPSRIEPVGYAAVRIVTGALLMPHGAQKLFSAFGGGGISGTAAFLEKVGYPVPYALASGIGLLEFFGGLALVVGLATRSVAVLVAAFMFSAVQFHSQFGVFWTNDGFEYPFLWGVVALYLALRGGGRYSLDQKIFGAERHVRD